MNKYSALFILYCLLTVHELLTLSILNYLFTNVAKKSSGQPIQTEWFEVITELSACVI